MKILKQNEIDSFIGQVFELGSENKSLAITLPYKLVEFAGIKKGDNVKVWFRKMEK